MVGTGGATADKDAMTSSQEQNAAPGMMVWPLVAIGAVLGGLAGGFVTHNLPAAVACALVGAGAVGILAWQAMGGWRRSRSTRTGWLSAAGSRPATCRRPW